MPYNLLREIRLSRVARVPHGYQRTVRWVPQIGDLVPDFTVSSTEGPIRFHDWAEGSWSVLFSHPSPFSPVCTTEVAALASLQPEFEARGVRLLGVSTGSLADQHRWHAEIRRLFGVQVGFPMAADEGGLLADLFGMIHAAQSPRRTIRKTFVIGPHLRLAAIAEYPLSVGRSTEELLRLVDALQTADTFDVAAGADWVKGDECLLMHDLAGPPPNGGATWQRLTAYLRTVADPWAAEAAEAAKVAADGPARPASLNAR